MTNIKKAAKADQSIKRPHKKTLEPSLKQEDTTLTRVDAIEAFRQKLLDSGAMVDFINPDSDIQRVKAQGDKGSQKSFWYSLHTDGNIPAGAYGNFKTGLSERWHIKLDKTPLTDTERAQLAKKYETKKTKRLAEQEKQYAQARRVANSIWNSASPANPKHPYLVTKHIQGATRYLRQSKDNLIVPLYKSQRLSSLQFLGNKGQKWFLKSSEINGAYFLFGYIKKPFDTAYLAEGISTSFTIFTLTDQAPVFACMNAGNLKNVALNVRKRWPDIKIIICADNDIRKDKNMANTGVEEAKKAALAVNGRVSIPNMPDGSKCDFNDLYCLSIESENKNKNGVKA